MSETERLRLGIFGVGRMGLVHLENLVRLAAKDEIHLVVIGDRYSPTVRAALDRISQWVGSSFASNLKRYETPAAMAREARLDAVVVATRTCDHVADSRAFTEHEIPVMVEKPLAGSVSEAAAFCNGLGVRGSRLVQVALQRYFDEPARVAADWVSEGRLGKLQQSHHVLQDKNPTPVNYQSGGITADMAIHLIFEAMAFHDFELPSCVQAVRFMAPYYEDHANEGANIVHTFCQWQDGSLAHLWGSRLNSTGYDNGFKLIGTSGRIDVGDFVGDFGDVSVKLWEGTDDRNQSRGRLTESLTFPMTRPAPGHPDFYARYASAYAAELDAFLNHVRQGTPFELGPEIGWKSQLVADLAEQSSRDNGQRIELRQADGSAIRTADEAAAFAAAAGVA